MNNNDKGFIGLLFTIMTFALWLMGISFNKKSTLFNDVDDDSDE